MKLAHLTFKTGFAAAASLFLAGLGCGNVTTDTKLGNIASAKTTTGTVSTLTATLDSGSGCVTNVNTALDSDLPTWIKDNFKCQVVYKDGSNYVFKSVNLPNHKSYYYCGSQTKNGGCTNKGTLYENFTVNHSYSLTADNGTNYGAGTNIIATQNFVINIPINPTPQSGTLTSTQAGQATIGITVNGLQVFNNSAAPGDTLTQQAFTFDNYAGHPDGTNIYHHHSEVYKVSSSMASGALLGIMLDGYALYDEKCDQNDGVGAKTLTFNGSAAVGNSTTDSAGSSTTALDRLHGHTTTTKHFSTATYHYHYSQDATATAAGATYATSTKTLVGSYFRGVQGTSTN